MIKTNRSALIAASSLTTLSLIATPAMAQSQAAMNETRCAEEQAANQQLNRIYQQVLSRHRGDAAATQAIQQSQAAWQAFRMAQLEAIDPGPDTSNYGTTFGMCQCIDSTALIQQRIDQLSAWLKPQEGDVCAGSRR